VIGGFAYIFPPRTEGWRNCQGAVRVVNAKVSGDLDCSGTEFKGAGGLIAEHATAGRLLWTDVTTNPQTMLSLANMRTRILIDNQISWPARGNLPLDGFTYEAIGFISPADAVSRLNWLDLQPDAYFSFQPYEQLIRVLREKGDEGGARTVYIEKRRAIRKRGSLAKMAQFWSWFLDWSIRYGYETWRALIGAVLIVLIGALMFWVWSWKMQTQLAQTLAVKPAKQETVKGSSDVSRDLATVARGSESRTLRDCDQFASSFFYSLDVFLPFGDLHLKKAHPLQARHPEDWGFYVFELWYVFEMVSGWVVAGLIAAALTGLIRR
jgi:hypothetical protein